jgi:uncharacterized low-complexity protein
MKKIHKTPLAVTLGTTLLSGLVAANAHAGTVLSGENPFALQELSSGYMQSAEAEPAKDNKAQQDMKKMEGACGEGKCGAKMMQSAKDAGGAKKPGESAAVKAMEGKCAGMKKK